MNLVEWLLFFIILTPMAILGIDSFLQRVRVPQLVSSHEETTQGIVLKKYYIPDHENIEDPDVLTDDFSFVYIAYATIPSKYIVELAIDKDVLILDSEHMFHLVQVGNTLVITLEHHRLLQTCLYSKHHSFKTKIKHFHVTPESDQLETQERI